MARTEKAQFEVIQNGLVVAAVEGPADSALKDALHYLAVYLQDGDAELRARNDEGWAALKKWGEDLRASAS